MIKLIQIQCILDLVLIILLHARECCNGMALCGSFTVARHGMRALRRRPETAVLLQHGASGLEASGDSANGSVEAWVSRPTAAWREEPRRQAAGLNR